MVRGIPVKQRAQVFVSVGVFAVIAAVASILAYVKWSELHGPAGPAWEPAEAVEVATAASVEWQPTADLIGTVFSLRSVEVRNELAGRVTSVGFDSGAVVDSGAVLLTLDDATERADLQAAQAAVREAQAMVADADARLAFARLEVARMERIAAADIMSANELDRVRAEADRAVATRAGALAMVEVAKARVAQVEARLAKLTITAPFRARAGMRFVHPGQYLSEGTSIVALEEVSDRIYLDFAVPQDHAARVRPGMSVVASAAALGGEPLRIEVVSTDARVDGSTRNLRVRAVVENRNALLRPGMFVQVKVPVEAPRAYVMVPTTAVRRTSYADQLFVVVPPAGEGQPPRVKQRFVELGATVGDRVIVLEGLQAGEQVAASGSFKLRDGAAINVVAAAGATAAPVGSSAAGK